jgi:hypothetical protein
MPLAALLLVWPFSALLGSPPMPDCGPVVVCYDHDDPVCMPCDSALGAHLPGKVTAVWQVSGALARKLKQGKDYHIDQFRQVVIEATVARVPGDQFRVVYLK